MSLPLLYHVLRYAAINEIKLVPGLKVWDVANATDAVADGLDAGRAFIEVSTSAWRHRTARALQTD